MKSYLTQIFIFFIISSQSWAQSSDTIKNEESINELLELNAYTDPSELQKIINSKVSVSSKKELSLRETPGIISLLTSEEIKNSGARDLIDLLRLIPGLDFGTDVDFGIGLGIRGNWANEGKVLLLVDGIMNNEILFQTIQFGNHFPVDLIERIEIIRGPGSSIYGGAAEYGVINIITQGGNGLNGITAAGIYGQMQHTYGRRNVALSIGKKIQDFQFDVSAFAGQGNRSDQDYVNLGTEEIVNLKDTSSVSPFNLNLGVKYKNFSIRSIYDSYSTYTNYYRVSHTSFLTDIKYKFVINKKLSITPQLTYSDQVPWKYDKSYSEDYSYTYHINARRFKANLTASYDITNKYNLIIGTEYFNDQATDKLESGNFINGDNYVKYDNLAIFAQGLLKFRPVILTAGFRIDHHSVFGSAFVPRLALTKKIENLHFKILYSNSFRSPSIENMINPDIKPERSNIMELETGYQFTPEMLLTVNLFRISTKDPIIYTYEPSTELSYYINSSKSGSSGGEVEYKVRKGWGYINLSYSFYLANSGNTVEDYKVYGKDNIYLGFPNHKFTFNSSFRIWKGLTINPSAVIGSRRYGFTHTNFPVDEEGEIQAENVMSELPAYALVNLFLRYEGLLVKGLSFGLGVYDIFNQKPPFIQPYDGGYAPLPAPSREVVLKLSYNLSFD